jgi:Flp pilus assembly pilin Flp
MKTLEKYFNSKNKRRRHIKGQGLTEYTILLVLVAGVCISMVKTIGGQTYAKLKSFSGELKRQTSIRNTRSAAGGSGFLNRLGLGDGLGNGRGFGAGDEDGISSDD